MCPTFNAPDGDGAPVNGDTDMSKTEIALHRKYLTGMFKRRYPGAKMVWTDPLKLVDQHILAGRIQASGAGWRQRPMQAVVYLPKSWREGAGYRFA